MSSLDDRARAFEAKNARDQEHQFIVNMKACKILAKSIAEEILHLKPASVTRYCDKIISISVRHCGTQSMFEYIQSRLVKNNIEMSDHELETRYNMALQEARAIWK